MKFLFLLLLIVAQGTPDKLTNTYEEYNTVVNKAIDAHSTISKQLDERIDESLYVKSEFDNLKSHYQGIYKNYSKIEKEIFNESNSAFSKLQEIWSNSYVLKNIEFEFTGYNAEEERLSVEVKIPKRYLKSPLKLGIKYREYLKDGYGYKINTSGNEIVLNAYINITPQKAEEFYNNQSRYSASFLVKIGYYLEAIPYKLIITDNDETLMYRNIRLQFPIDFGGYFVSEHLVIGNDHFFVKRVFDYKDIPNVDYSYDSRSDIIFLTEALDYVTRYEYSHQGRKTSYSHGLSETEYSFVYSALNVEQSYSFETREEQEKGRFRGDDWYSKSIASMNQTGNLIAKFTTDSNSKYFSVWDELNKRHRISISDFNIYPTQIAFGSSDEIFLLNYGNIYKISLNGNITKIDLEEGNTDLYLAQNGVKYIFDSKRFKAKRLYKHPERFYANSVSLINRKYIANDNLPTTLFLGNYNFALSGNKIVPLLKR